MGLTGMILPEEYGGSGAGELELNIAMEEIARVSPSCAHILDSHLVLCGSAILHYGTDEQKQKYLPDIASGKKLGAYALTEPNAGSDVMNLQTKAQKTGTGYTLNGAKTFISNGEMCKTAVIIGNIPELAPKGTAAFIVEDGMKGFSKGEKFKKLGMKAATTAELFFEDCKIGEEQLLGKEGQGLRIALSTLDRGRIGIAAQAVGIAQGVLDLCVKYSKERVQFGGPISKQQAVAFKMADMATEIEAGRMLYQKAAYLADNGKPFSANAAMAKVFCCGTGHESGYRRHSDLRRIRLYDGIPGTALFPGCQTDRNLRRHFRSTANHYFKIDFEIGQIGLQLINTPPGQGVVVANIRRSHPYGDRPGYSRPTI